jgi:ABC-type uncharacterized transport system substrate-binding protein
MIRTLRPFLLPIGLIVLISAVLLAMDPRASGTRKGPPKVALVQHASIAALDSGVDGIVHGLAAGGFAHGTTLQLTRFNAQGDMGTANDIARQVTGGGFDLIVTASTLSLQSLANANKDKRVPHVFGIVADAAAAGVGISATDPLDHPEWMTGYNVRVPVIKGLELAREFNPDVKKVGLVWHSSEASSLVYTRDARAAVKQLGMELLEANAENAGEVGLAARSLVERGVEMFIITGDVVVLSAADSVIQEARKARIPVVSLIPPFVRKGSLADLGADYFAVGREVGELAAQVLAGAAISKLPVRTLAPLTLSINLKAIEGLRPGWKVPPAVVERADLVIDSTGERRRGAAPPASAASR